MTCTPSRCCLAGGSWSGRSSWITRHRRAVRDYERLVAHHETDVYWAVIPVMRRRLARQSGAAQPTAT